MYIKGGEILTGDGGKVPLETNQEPLEITVGGGE